MLEQIQKDIDDARNLAAEIERLLNIVLDREGKELALSVVAYFISAENKTLSQQFMAYMALRCFSDERIISILPEDIRPANMASIPIEEAAHRYEQESLRERAEKETSPEARAELLQQAESYAVPQKTSDFPVDDGFEELFEIE